MANFTNTSKHASSWTRQSKDATSFTNQAKTGIAPLGEFDIGLFDETFFDASNSPILITWTNQPKS
jgi:hypothetical protein